MRALMVLVVLGLGACLDWDGAAADYCREHPELCVEVADGGTPDAGP